MAPFVREKALRDKITKVQKKKHKDKSCDTEDHDEENQNEKKIPFDVLEDLISDRTMNAIKEMGFKKMTDIQAKTIPKLLKGFDLRGTAKTGSGKTLAFLIPVVELIVKLRLKPRNGTGAIIITPTRELAMQTYGVLRQLMTYHNQTFHLIIGGTMRKSEAEKLSKGMNILVATPGRLLDHLQYAPYFNFKNLSCLVIDEADRILDFGFQDVMKQIVQIIPRHRQTMLFSATKDHRTDSLALLFLKEKPLEIDIQINRNEVTADGLEQTYLICPREKRFLVLYKFIKKNHKRKVMVFFNSIKAVSFYHSLLNFISVPVMCIHGEQKPNQRSSTFLKFCREDSGVLLCTNIASRGLDIPSVDWIVQYDPPDDPKEYIHRVGRTARAGCRGKALLFLTEEEKDFVKILLAHKVHVDHMEIDWSKIPVDVQEQIEEIVSRNYHLRSVAKEAFIANVRAYESHSLKKIFDSTKLDLEKVAKCFFLKSPPFVSENYSYPKVFDQRKRKQNFETQETKYFETETKYFETQETKTFETQETKRPKITKFED